MKNLYPVLILSALACTSVNLLAKKTQSGRTAAQAPEQQQASFSVPDGYVIELVASEADGIVNPIDMAFDDAGRLWTQTARMYPLDPVKDIKWNELLRLMDKPEEQDKNPEFKRIKDLYQGKTKGKDDVLILSNIYEKGGVKVQKFATGLTIPQSILPYKNGAYVMQGSELFYLEDTDDDGISDKRTPVLTGFGFTDTHTMGHCLVRGPGGWVHFSQGALNKGKITAVKSGYSTHIDYSKIAKFSLDGTEIQLVNAGLNNIWGYQLRDNGQWFMTEANDQGWSVVPADPLTSYKGIGNQKLRTYQPFYPTLHKFRVGGTGISGLAFSDDQTGKFSTDYRNVAFLANPITSSINAVSIVQNPDGTVTAKHLPDFLTCEDDWFRPVHIDFGPDGNLYIADWYNKIVSHNEVDTTHPDRDKAHGRIWRVRPKTAKERKVPNLYKATDKALIDHLRADSAWERKAAWQQIADRQAKQLTPALQKLVVDKSASKGTRIHALWALESLRAFDADLMNRLTQDEDPDIRREALRSLVYLEATPGFLASVLATIHTEKNSLVRTQAIRTMEQLGETNNDLIDLLVTFCKTQEPGNQLGASYQTNFERALARRALEKYPAALTSYIASEAAKKQPAANLIWAQQSFDTQSADAFAKQWDILKKLPLTKETLILVSGRSPDAKVRDIVHPYFSDYAQAKNIAQVSLTNIAEAYSPSIGYPLAETAMVLMKSTQETDKILGIKLATAYRITHLSPQVAKLLTDAKTDALKLEIITALSYLPQHYADEFRSILKDKSNSAALHLSAISALTQAQGDSAVPAIKEFLSTNKGQRIILIQTLGSTTQGCKALVSLLSEKVITKGDIPENIVARIAHFYKNDPTVKELTSYSTEKQQQLLKEAKERIQKLEEYIEAKPGNPVIGKAIFKGMCLNCHAVADEGIGIAPALDGSAERALDHLLTAILRPDDAAENAYILFRAVETSGHINEGLVIKQDGRGITLAQQGGTTQFHPSRTLSKPHFVGSRSFMPSTFSNLPDSTIADLIAHIKTLK